MSARVFLAIALLAVCELRTMTSRRVAVPLLIAVLSTAVPADAQHVDRRGFIGLGVGPSMPVGSFARESPVHSMGQGATTGYTSTLLNLGYRFRTTLGLAAAISYGEYSIPGAGDDDWWQVASVTAGPMYSFRLNERTGLDLKGMVGMVVLTPVEDGYTTVYDVGGGIGFDLRAALRHDVLRRWALFAEGGWQSSSVSFDSSVGFGHRALISGFGFAYRPSW